MSRIFVLSHPEARCRCQEYLTQAPDGLVVRFSEPTRTGEQNAALHARIGMNDKVVFLAYRTDKADTDGKEVLACARCRNKAWTAVFDGDDGYPRLVCTACATDGGTFGWVQKEPA